MSDCSVVIVNYNSGTVVSDAVRSALENGATKVIVVDNGSVDNSLAHLEQTLGASEPVIVIRNGANLGFAAGCNIGAKMSGSPAILFLNPDCRLLPGAMPSLLRTLWSGSDIGIVGPLLQNPDGTEQRGGRRRTPNFWSSLVQSLGLGRIAPRFLSDFNQHTEPLPQTDIDVEVISGGCMMIRRDALNAVEGWDEGYFLHVEDIDICVRIRQAGWRIIFTPKAAAIHIKGVSSKGRAIFVERHKHLGMIRFYNKFMAPAHPVPLQLVAKASIWVRFGFVAARSKVRQLFSC